MKLEEQIAELSSQIGLSGSEKPIANYLEKKLKSLSIQTEIDRFGNVHGRMPAAVQPAKTLLLEAHMDQIGLMISGIDDGGYLKFVNLGGVDERILCGMEVKILSAPPCYGVIGAYTPNLEDDEKKKRRNAKLEELRIDAGLSAEAARENIRVGSGVVMQAECTKLMDGKLSGMAMDNRAGVAAILECIANLQEEILPYNLEILFSTQEELGLHGAYTGIIPGMADAAIAVDVTHGTTPDSKEETGVFPLGSGAVICRGPNLHYDYTKQLISLARGQGVSHEIEVASGGSGTTAWAIQMIGTGIPVMLVSIPLRYMHTNVETLAVRDVQAVVQLLTAAAKGGVRLA